MSSATSAQRPGEVPARARLEAAGHDRDPRALRREPPGDRRADAPARSGDDRNLAGQCIAHGGWTIVAWCRPVASSIASAVAPVAARGLESRSTSVPISTNATRRGSATSSPTCSSATTPRPSGPTSPRSPTRTARSPTRAGSGSSRMLAREFWTDAAAVDRAIAARHAATGEASRRGRRTRRCAPRSRPPTARLLRLFTGLDDGVKFLVDLRADELRLAADPEIGTDDATALDRARPRAQGAARDAVRRRPARAAPHHVGRAGRAPREADRVRGGAHDRLVGRPQEPARLRPALLRVLPSRRCPTSRSCSSRSRSRPARRACSPPLLDAHGARARPRPRRHRGLLFDLELPARPRGREPRHRARSSRSSSSSGATCRSCSASSRCRRSPAIRAWLDDDAARRTICAPHERALLPAAPERVLARLSHAGVGRRRGDPARALSRCARATSRRRATAARSIPVANFHLANGAVDRAHQLARRSEPDRARALGRAHGQLRVRARPHRGRAPRRSSTRSEVPMSNAVRELLH